MVFYSSQSIFFPFGIIFSLSFQKQGRRKDSMFGKDFFPRRAANASPHPCFYYIGYVPSRYVERRNDIRKNSGKSFTEKRHKVGSVKASPSFFYESRFFSILFFSLRRASLRFLAIRKEQDTTVVTQLIRHIHLKTSVLIKPIASFINISMTSITMKATEKPIEI